MPLIRRILISVALVAAFAAFFTGGPNSDSPRSFGHFWDLGHIFFFSLLPVVLFRVLHLSRSFKVQALATLALALAGGTAIELIQSLMQRTFDLDDVLRNMIGAGAGLLFLMPGRRSISKPWRRLLQASCLAAVVTQLFPLAAVLSDEMTARSQFPVLSDFETPFEIDRWRSHGAVMHIDAEVRHGDRASLRVALAVRPYSGAFLEYFPGDWRGFRSLQLSVCNPSPEPLALFCRIHDQAHAAGDMDHEDRFGREFLFPPGWTTVTVELDDVAAAPRNRRMDMGRIRGVGLFAVDLPQPRTVYIDDVRLDR